MCPSQVLYEAVRIARNEALHQGAYARHLTTHAIQLSLVLEDALMSSLSKVCDYMVRDPVCAYKWQPVSFIRQQMLANSFTYLPVFMEASWNLISDSNVARYLLADNNQRKVRLAKTLRNAVDLQELQLETAKTVEPETPIKKVVQNFKGKPVLVCRQGHLEDLLGILTAFDLL